MPTLEILGVPHAYELTAPTASPNVLVFIHGWLLSRGYWQPVIDRLSADYQCLSYDLRGFGYSQPLVGIGHASLANRDPRLVGSPSEVERRIATADADRLTSPATDAILRTEWDIANALSTSRYSLLAYARDLLLLLQALNISRAWLVGHSLGGSIALWGADQGREWVQGVICLNSGGGIYLKEEFERFRLAGQQLLRLRPRWLCHLPLIDLLFTRASVARTLDRHWGRQRLVDFVMAQAEAALGTLLDSTTEAEVHRLPQVVARLPQPVYFIAGQQDPIMEPRYVRHLASFHPLFQEGGENVIELPDCGHMTMLEQPDQLTEEIRGILRHHS